jgi:hypothetical protein
MSQYFKYTKDNDIYIIDVRNWSEKYQRGTANYYKNGELWAELQPYKPQSTDEEISRDEFYQTIK